jgi:YHS domain-containing protein
LGWTLAEISYQGVEQKMNCLAKQAVVGAVFALGLIVGPAVAQHDGHSGQGDHEREKMVASIMKAFPDANCPVTGEPINLAISTRTSDGPVFFCCEGCVKKFNDFPRKFAPKVAAQRKAMASRAKVQVICPVTEEPVDGKSFVETENGKVSLCCKGCVKKYKRSPQKYAAALANSYTYQTMCPVMGGEIDPTVFTKTAKGVNIYFCCAGCDKKFTSDPQKYIPKLAGQGFTVEAKDMGHDGGGGGDHSGHDHKH